MNFLERSSKNTQIIFLQIRTEAVGLFYADGQTDRLS